MNHPIKINKNYKCKCGKMYATMLTMNKCRYDNHNIKPLNNIFRKVTDIKWPIIKIDISQYKTPKPIKLIKPKSITEKPKSIPEEIYCKICFKNKVSKYTFPKVCGDCLIKSSFDHLSQPQRKLLHQVKNMHIVLCKICKRKRVGTTMLGRESKYCNDCKP